MLRLRNYRSKMKILLSIIILVLAGCTMPPVSEPEFAGFYRNACLPEAIAMSQALKKSDIQTRVLRIQTNKWAHAVTVYLYPTGQNQLYVWDSYWHSINLRAWYNDPVDIATEWLSYTNPKILLVKAYFLD
jgi:hypothetical protein